MKSLELAVAQPVGTASGCCLSPQELEVRRAEWNNLSTQGLIDVAQDCEDLVLRYRRDPEVEAVLRYLVTQEGTCCSSVRFDISVSDDELALRISGPWQETPWAGAAVSEPTANVREFVRARYAAVAQAMTELNVVDQSGANGCGAAFDPNDLEQLEGLKGVSLGCGNSIGLARLKEGEIVLDLGSGAGLEAFVAAKRVGEAGYVYGLDMTDEMFEIARENQAAAGIENVEFLKGQIERVPLPDASVDVIISNCVVNLSSSKGDVFAEMSRVLKPGGRIALSDVVADQEPAEGQADLNTWASCLTGAITRERYGEGLKAAGLEDIAIEESHEIQRGYASVLIKGRKPFISHSRTPR